MTGPRNAARHATRLLVLLVATALGSALLLSACDSRPRETEINDRIAGQYIDSYEAIVRTMERIDDAESARAGAQEIRELKAEMQVLGERVAGYSAEYQKHFSRRFGPRFALLREKMAEERRRIAALPAVDAAFAEAMRGGQEAAAAAGG